MSKKYVDWGGILERRKNLYQFVYTDLKEQILSERWEYGSRLPSVDRLALHYYVGKWTIQKALELLEKDGLIRTEERRRGTFGNSRLKNPGSTLV